MSARQRKPAKQVPLFEDEPEPWKVKVAIVKDRSRTIGTLNPDGLHKLTFLGVVKDKGTGRAALERLQAQARHFNLRRAKPQTPIKGTATTPDLI